ncbi:MAG: molybdopterin-dependent oxidoreductase [Gemmatimonadota bacterium]|nr:molybdopterin-dependent oxidoreductase [Gemmatimonadota bacterium]
MGSTRRQFLWAMGATAASVGVRWTSDVVWAAQGSGDPGWSPGTERFVNSSCLVCPARCGIRGRVVDDRLVRLTGNPFHPMSRGGLCPRGVAGVQLLYHPDRISAPCRRVGARGAQAWEEITWDDALGQLGARLQSLRQRGQPEALALLAGYCAGSMHDLWQQFLQSYGSPNYIADDYDDGTAAVMELMHGIGRSPGYDLERAGFVLSFGAPLFEAWWSPLQAFAAFAGPDGDNGAPTRFVQVDTRFSRTAARAHDWAGIRPGTFGVLALGIAYVLIRDELYDAEFVARHVSGFEDVADAGGERREGYRSLVMRNYRTEEVSAVTGVPVGRITSLARAFAEAAHPVAVCGPDVTHAPNGLLAACAVHSLNVLMGSVSRPGGVLFGNEAPLAPLAAPVVDPRGRAGLDRGPLAPSQTPFGRGDPAMRFAGAVAAGEAGAVDTLLLYYANPLASALRRQVWEEALQRIPFIVSFSPFHDETTAHADLILPDLLAYERWQDAPTPASYPYPVWGVVRPLVDPHPGARHTGDAVLAVARQLGGSVARSLPYESFETLLKARAAGLFATRRGMTLGDAFELRHQQQMEERGWWLPEHREFEAFWDEAVDRGGWTDPFIDETEPAGLARTSSGRIELLPARLLEALATVGEGRTAYLDVAAAAAGGSDDFPLRLIPYRVSTLSSGTLPLQRWLAETPGLFPDVHWDPWIEVAPTTANTLGFANDTMVWVVSAHGRYRARLKVFPGTAPQNVCAPYGLRHPDGEPANPLHLLDGSSDPLTALPNWFTTFVRLERA